MITKGLSAGRYRPSIATFLKGIQLQAPRLEFEKSALVTMNVIVPDVSFYQDINNTARKIDFHQMKAAGARGVIIRAGQNLWVDEDFVYNWQAAKDADLPRGCYWFLDPRAEPRLQADKLSELIVNDPPELDTWADYEAPDSWGGNYAGWDGLYNYLERLNLNLPNVKKTIYTGYYYWLDHSPTLSASLNYFKKYKVNIAWYTSNPADVKIPPPWTNDDLLWWQFTDNGNGLLYGVESKSIDLNYCNLSLNDFYSYFNLYQTPPDGGSDMEYGKVTASALNIRSSAGVTATNDIGDLLMGDIVMATQVVNGWWHLQDATRNGLEIRLTDGRTVFERYRATDDVWCSGQYIAITEPPQPTPALPAYFTAHDEAGAELARYIKQ